MSQHYGNVLPRSDLALLFDPANPKCYPGSGSTIYDMSGHGNNGTISGSMVFTYPYMVFDGTDDQINVTANQSSLNFRYEQTLIIWMYHTFTSGRRNPWDQAYGGYGTWTHESGANISSYVGDAGSNASPYIGGGSASTPTSTWQMMATVRNTVDRRWYRNGSLSSTTAHSYGVLTETTANIRIGNGYAGRWIGNMGMVMAYKRALNADEMSTIYERTRGVYGV